MNRPASKPIFKPVWFAIPLAILTVADLTVSAQHSHEPSPPADSSDHDTGKIASPASSSDAQSALGVHGRSPVELDQGQRQLINIRTAPATIGPAVVTIRTVGILAYDDTRISDVNTRIMGWAESLHVDKPGQFVTKGEPMMDIYSPELYSAQSEYLLAFRHCERLEHLDIEASAVDRSGIWKQSMRDAETLLESARKRLRLWEVTEDEIRTLEETGTPRDTVRLTAPVTGYVIEKGIEPAQMVRPGMTLYRVADLSTVWVNADIYEFELALVEVGQDAVVTAVAYPDRAIPATVDFIYPYSDNRTRTTKVRLVLDNSEGLLKPDTYVNVELKIDEGTQLLIEDTAVFDTGTRQYVFVEEHPGHFIPRTVKLGPKVGRRYTVASGIKVGEAVVIDGNFLLDSESQLSAAGTGGGHQH